MKVPRVGNTVMKLLSFFCTDQRKDKWIAEQTMWICQKNNQKKVLTSDLPWKIDISHFYRALHQGQRGPVNRFQFVLTSKSIFSYAAMENIVSNGKKLAKPHWKVWSVSISTVLFFNISYRDRMKLLIVRALHSKLPTLKFCTYFHAMSKQSRNRQPKFF